jgi:hypothetical protein
MNRFRSTVFTAFVAFVLAGCSAFPAADRNTDPEAVEVDAKVDIHAPFPVTFRAGIEDIKLIEMLAGEQEGRRIASMPRESEDPVNGVAWSTKYDFAFAAFYRRLAGDPEFQKLERNRIQERILMASDQRCTVFKTNHQRDQSRSNFWFGALGTFAGALGAVSSGVQSAKNLAATAGVLSGVRAEYNQAFYSNLLFAVITRGIDERRREAYRIIQQEGQTKAIGAYPAEAAIKDAILYDGLCNTAAGLEQAQESIRLAADPGIDTFNRMLLKANVTRSILENKITDPSELEKSGTDLKAGTLVSKATRTEFGSHLSTPDNVPVTAIDAMTQAEKDKIEKGIDAALKKLTFPQTLAESERSKVVGEARAKISSPKGVLFRRLDVCVQMDGADSIRKLVIARSRRQSASTDQERTVADRGVMAEESQLRQTAFTIQRLSERFSAGLKDYAAYLDKQLADGKVDKAAAVKADIPADLTASGKGRWDFGDGKTCGAG